MEPIDKSPYTKILWAVIVHLILSCTLFMNFLLWHGLLLCLNHVIQVITNYNNPGLKKSLSIPGQHNVTAVTRTKISGVNPQCYCEWIVSVPVWTCHYALLNTNYMVHVYKGLHITPKLLWLCKWVVQAIHSTMINTPWHSAPVYNPYCAFIMIQSRYDYAK